MQGLVIYSAQLAGCEVEHAQAAVRAHCNKLGAILADLQKVG